jgi:serine/threonine protein phosphatase 1
MRSYAKETKQHLPFTKIVCRRRIMSYIYAMSDIHGELDIFKKALNFVDLSKADNKLILLGDYINRGEQSCETLYFIKQLYEQYKNQVVVLRGNHEEMFLEQLNRDYIAVDTDYVELKNYLSNEDLTSILENGNPSGKAIVSKMLSLIKMKHKELIYWLRNLPYYYETETQIYVHAGVDEEAEELWKWGSENFYFVSKYPFVTGSFYKDIIAGHVCTSTIVNDENYHKVYWDKENHLFIDGNTNRSKFIPILKYDSSTGKYSSFEKVEISNSSMEWQECVIK